MSRRPPGNGSKARDKRVYKKILVYFFNYVKTKVFFYVKRLKIMLKNKNRYKWTFFTATTRVSRVFLSNRFKLDERFTTRKHSHTINGFSSFGFLVHRLLKITVRPIGFRARPSELLHN